MDFMIQKYTTKQTFVKVPENARSPVNKEQISLKTRNFKGSGTYVHFMDKTEILFAFSEFLPVSLPVLLFFSSYYRIILLSFPLEI